MLHLQLFYIETLTRAPSFMHYRGVACDVTRVLHHVYCLLSCCVTSCFVRASCFAAYVINLARALLMELDWLPLVHREENALVKDSEHREEIPGNSQDTEDIFGDSEGMAEGGGEEFEDSEDTDKIPGDSEDTEEIPGDSEDTEEIPGDSEDTEEIQGDSEDTEEIPGDTEDTEKIPEDNEDTDEIQGDSEDTEEIQGDSEDTEEIFGDSEGMAEVDSEESEVDKVCSCTMFSSSACKPVAHEKKLKQVLHDNQYLRNEIKNLKATIKRLSLSSEALEADSAKLLHYTGIPDWTVFKALLALVEPALPEMRSELELSKFQRLLMFLMKVRLNLHDMDLAYRFNVHKSTVSRNFHAVLDALYIRLQPLIIWPDRETLRKTMPSCFRRFFDKCCVIIDCTEVFIERAKNLLARAQCWSNYKHHSTIKFLLGITPQGTISYVSRCVGGRMSDKEIVERSTIMNYLLPGDLVIADRGFTGDSMSIAEVKTPPFTKGKLQLDKSDEHNSNCNNSC